MAARRFAIAVLALALASASLGCTRSSAGGGTEAGAKAPKAFKLETSSAKELPITAEGGGAGLSTGEAYAAVSVPAGAAGAATWKITPLAEAPAGVKNALCPGIFVDTDGKEPTDWCAIGFSLPGTAPEGATIVKLADDGTVAEVVATDRFDYGDRTFLTAYVKGFSAYTTSEQDQEARDKAFTDRAKEKGQTPDWTIKVIGAETQEIQGWTFNYELDMFASGGSIGKGGTYTGHAMLSVDGTYDDAGAYAPFFTTAGAINAIGRDQALTFTMIDPPLASLLTGAGGDMPFAEGVMNLEGMGDFAMTAEGMQGEKGSVDEQDVQGTSPVNFTLKATTFEDVQVEIENCGIFPGKILRTAQ